MHDTYKPLGMDIIELLCEMICNGSIIEAIFAYSVSIDNLKIYLNMRSFVQKMSMFIS